jgi:hypothetical protein
VNNMNENESALTFRVKTTAREVWSRAAIREIVMVVGLFLVYWLVHGCLPDKEMVAFQNAGNIIQIERNLHIYLEPEIQSWFLANRFLVQLANAIYTVLFYPVLISFAVLAFKRRRLQYSFARNIFFISAVLGLICFAFYPTAPPRLTPAAGFVDTLTEYQPVNYNFSMSSALVNQYAAVPSFHFAWTFLVGVATCWIARAWWLKLLGLILPFLVLVAIVATANHFFFDAFAGLVIISISFGLCKFIKRLKRRPGVLS